MKILIIGNGGREHALAWKVAQNPKVSDIYLACGNAGTALEPKMHNINIAVTDIPALVDFAQQNQMDLTLVGPELPLVLGVVDAFLAAGLPCFGPSKNAAQLEGSKAFTKHFLARHHIPTAAYQVFTACAPAKAHVQQQGLPLVIKADGLAAGKGVIIAQTEQQAFATIDNMLAGNAFGQAGHSVVIEEFLSGEEASFICMVDGKNVLPLASSQDHKARDDGDLGPNTGGMGAYSPAPVVDARLHDKIMQQIIGPTVNGMAAEGNTYRGFLYAGIMVDDAGNPKVLEYNCRFGDPETQPIMMRLQSDLVELCLASLDQRLDQMTAQWSSQSALGVVLAAGGYPDDHVKGDVITLPQQLPEGCKIFHAGTKTVDGQVVVDGGRVLCVCALGDTVTAAQQRAYAVVEQVHWRNMYYRTDIGHRALARELKCNTSIL
jgi:phosphoribosylamine--glycine ligase